MTTYEENKIPDVIDGIEVIQDISIAMDMLVAGNTIARYEFGDSMMPILSSGQFCKIVPLKEGDEVKQGDAVFAYVNGYLGTHLVWMISETNGKKYYCIATTQGSILGWTDSIYGIAYGIPHVVKASRSKIIEPTVGYSQSTPMPYSSNELSTMIEEWRRNLVDVRQVSNAVDIQPLNTMIDDESVIANE